MRGAERGSAGDGERDLGGRGVDLIWVGGGERLAVLRGGCGPWGLGRRCGEGEKGWFGRGGGSVR
ncbi:hypothetical protein GCM10010349_30400 [Streptomyces flavofungini]|nr:hypothetical protein GCM10010349_30400 [Streptomyces flavofungini]